MKGFLKPLDMIVLSMMVREVSRGPSIDPQ